ncbi:MAG: response regulator [Phycisphaerae bacterium]|nr:MAG: response regulator [Planctomycetota bacterium]KAB2949970.1 MAG: response regulator [Phycisphaerae bacterium]MBE7458601.1 response regulator [Planctomycetia bacterium]MCK6465058.1 response regulator [Phycisphaerae bacterium]MCL4718644.1 response regulator [Phycisphaerae bacterium]
MHEPLHKILLIEPEARVVEMMIEALTREFAAQITCLSHGAEALDVELLEPHDLVVATMDPPDLEGAELAEHLASISRRPVIVTARDLNVEETLRLLRAGVREVLLKPFPIAGLVETARRALEAHRLQREHARRHRQLRELTRRFVRERRQLNEKVELVCRDLVGAHRRLVQRVLRLEDRAETLA